jgi:fumarylacetoacetase
MVQKSGEKRSTDHFNIPTTSATMHLPVSIGNFTDFSCSKDHVPNAGEAIMKKRSLPPGFLHFPIGYAGRASSIVVSGTPITRPKGQFRDPEKGSEVVFAPTRELDYELEVACIVGKPSQLGKPVPIAEADEHVFGLVLLNDWSGKHILWTRHESD